MRYTARHAVVLGFGILMLAGVAARSDEAAGAREQIIQGVRDDVRRKIQERNEMPAENREDVATGSKQPTNAPAHSNTRQEKSDAPK